MKDNKTQDRVLIGVNEKVSYPKALLLGFQHVLAMDLYIAPLIIAGILALSFENTSLFVQMCFLATGIATLIQVGIGIKLPVIQGPSYVPIGAIGAIGSKLGLGAVVGSLIPGAILIALIGYPLKVFAKSVRKLMPPLVSGVVIIVVGIALMEVSANGVFDAEGDMGHNLLIAAITLTVLLACTVIGNRVPGVGIFFRMASVIIAIVIGTIAAAFLGDVDFSPVSDAKWFALPKLFSLATPEFHLGPILTMTFVYFIILVETTGTWFVVSTVTGEKLTNERLNKASFGEGLGCITASLIGSGPVTGYSSNAGLLALTGVTSRMVIFTGGGILIFLGLTPKFSSIITSIPGPVISAVFAMVCVAIVANGFKVIQPFTINDRNMIIMGIPIFLTIATILLPSDVLNHAPEWAGYILSSGITVGALATLILNLVIPRDAEDKEENRISEDIAT